MPENAPQLTPEEKPRRVEETVILPLAESDAPVSPPPAGPAAGDDDFRVLALDALTPQPVSLGPVGQHLHGFAVFISRAAVRNIIGHGELGLKTNHEVAGGLVGLPCIDPATQLVYTRISDAWPVQGHADQYEVEIPPEEWFRLSNRTHDEEASEGRRILVGWYHSHPTFDAYLSALDQQTQRQFFGEKWNVAIVIGPERHQIKAFHSGQSTPCMLYLDPVETGGELVTVKYEVPTGGVSTMAGVEWLEPSALAEPEAAPPVEEVYSQPEAAPPPAYPPAAPAPPLGYPHPDYSTTVLDPTAFDPDEDLQIAYAPVHHAPAPPAYPPAAPVRAVGSSSVGISPLVIILSIVVIVLLLIVIALIIFHGPLI